MRRTRIGFRIGEGGILALPLLIPSEAALYADFTTEGGTNNYWFGGTQYAGSAAWLTALAATFTRASSAYYTNSSGLLASAASNVLRFDYNPSTLAPNGILTEGASTNVCINSGDIALWSPGPSAAVTSNAATAPDGTNTATLVYKTATTTTANQGVWQSAVTSGVSTSSVFLKDAGFSWVAMYDPTNTYAAWFNISTGTVGTVQSGISSATITPYPGGWYRLTTTNNSGNGSYVQFIPVDSNGSLTSTVNGSSGIYAWGGQQEALPFASSYIPTTSTTATRAADNLSTTSVAWYNTTAGTLMVDADTSGMGNYGLTSIFGNASGSSGLDLRAAVPLGPILAVIYSSGSYAELFSSDAGQSPYTLGSPSIAALTSGPSGSIYVRNGGTADTNAFTLSGSVSAFSIGNDGAIGASPNYGHIRRIGYWPVAGTVAQLQSLTSGTP